MSKNEGSRSYFESGGYPEKNNSKYVTNGKVACEPFKALSAETTGKAFMVVKQKIELSRLKVLWGNERFLPGSYVYVRGDNRTLPWVHEVFDMNNQKFILVPESYIQMVEVNNPSNDTSATV